MVRREMAYRRSILGLLWAKDGSSLGPLVAPLPEKIHLLPFVPHACKLAHWKSRLQLDQDRDWNAQNKEVVHTAERSLGRSILVALSHFSQLVESALKLWAIEHFEAPMK
jgi:hypothetical protein